MILVLVPVPYVDASARPAFRSKWQRALVGAAGMIVEVFLAALALYVWLAVEDGLVRAMAFNVMLIAGVSTVMFNGNPLLRFDGYYMLSDLLEIPNLAQRANTYWAISWTTLRVQRGAIRPDSMRTVGERLWLLLLRACILPLSRRGYARDRGVHRLGIFRRRRADRDLGRCIARLCCCRSARRVRLRVHGPAHTTRNRARAIAMVSGFAAVACSCSSCSCRCRPTPRPRAWCGCPRAQSCARADDGFVRRLLAEPGQTVSAGEALVESEEPDARRPSSHDLQARVGELEARLCTERFADRVSAEITATNCATPSRADADRASASSGSPCAAGSPARSS